MQSLKFASRQVVLHPWLSAAVVLVLAVGISTTTAALSVFYQVVRRPIAAPEPERLVDLSETGTKPGVLICSPAGFCDVSSAFSYPMFRDLEAQQSSFTGIAAQFGLRPGRVTPDDVAHALLLARRAHMDRAEYRCGHRAARPRVTAGHPACRNGGTFEATERSGADLSIAVDWLNLSRDPTNDHSL
jgi:hypothetical protein